MKALLFDLEGTLVESAYQQSPELVVELRFETRDKLLELGVPEDILSGLVRSSALRNRAYQWAEDTLSAEEAGCIRAEVEAFMLSWDMASARRAVPYPDTLKALTGLSEAGVVMGIVTNTSKTAADFVLNKLGLNRFFGAIATRSDVPRLKPDPAMIRLAISILGMDVGWLVGDATFDARAAINAGMGSIIIRRDGVPPDFEHDRFIRSLEEVSPIILGA
jgi:phosphoglycolate phosphatase-like HAD superfamily hydrolase